MNSSVLSDVVIPTNSAEKSNIVLKAGQRVMVLKSPKGIYMQLESGKIIAIKTSFKVGQTKDGAPGAKESTATVKKGNYSFSSYILIMLHAIIHLICVPLHCSLP